MVGDCENAGFTIEKLEADKEHRLHLIARKPIR